LPQAKVFWDAPAGAYTGLRRMMRAVAPGGCGRQSDAATICRIAICALIAYRASLASVLMQYRFSTEKK
jgi:hypothetical protein